MKATAHLAPSLFLASIAALCVNVARAETYDGVLRFETQRDRGSVHAEAVAAANAPDQNVVPGSRGPLPFKPMAAREQVQAEAVAAAHAPDQNVVPGSRVNSRVVPTMPASPAASASASAQR